MNENLICFGLVNLAVLIYFFWLLHSILNRLVEIRDALNKQPRPATRSPHEVPEIPFVRPEESKPTIFR